MRLFTILRILFIFPVSMELFPLFGNSKNKECNVCKNLLNFPRTAVIITYLPSHPHARSQESKIFGRVFLPLNASGRIFRL